MRRSITLFLFAAAAACTSTDVNRTLGARCDDNADCDVRCLPPALSQFPGGFCTVPCNADGDCPGAEAACVDAEGGSCLFVCMDDRDCDFLNSPSGSEGWACREAPSQADPMTGVLVCIGP